jgi:tRNA-Thr(GGU) m(6)t(6)A37 methyltransferase TsaA
MKQEAWNTVASPLTPIGVIRSTLRTRPEAPKQGCEGAPNAWLEIAPAVARGLRGIAAGEEIIVITWLHRARRDVLEVRPRSDKRLPLTGVFATRSPDRPNPLGLHRVRVVEIAGNRLKVGPIEARRDSRGRRETRAPRPSRLVEDPHMERRRRGSSLGALHSRLDDYWPRCATA